MWTMAESAHLIHESDDLQDQLILTEIIPMFEYRCVVLAFRRPEFEQAGH